MDIDIAVEISRLYVSFFNRAADPEGLQYWISRYEQELAKGRSGALFLEDMADSFAQSPEAKALYATSDNPSQEEIRSYITDAYFNMFGRVPDDEGLDYWASRWQTELDAGRPGVRVLFEIENAARGSQNEQDKEALKNKAEIAAQFTDEFIKSGATWEEGDVAKAKEVVAKVDHTPESVQQASQEIAEFIEDKTDEGQIPVDDGDDDGGDDDGEGTTPVDDGPALQPAAVRNGNVVEITGAVELVESGDFLVISRAGRPQKPLAALMQS